MSDPKMIKLRGGRCQKKYLSDSQGRCYHPEKKYVECVTALRRGKCPVDSGWKTFEQQQEHTRAQRESAGESSSREG